MVSAESRGDRYSVVVFPSNKEGLGMIKFSVPVKGVTISTPASRIFYEGNCIIIQKGSNMIRIPICNQQSTYVKGDNIYFDEGKVVIHSEDSNTLEQQVRKITNLVFDY